MHYKLYFLLIGCTLKGRHTEQHDVYFGIGKQPADLVPAIKSFWPEAEKLHVDCWREVTNVNGFQIKVIPKTGNPDTGTNQLYFMNLGGYRKGAFEEFHFRELVVAPNQEEAVRLAKKTGFYKDHGFKGAVAHIDDRYGVDIDEIHPVSEILSPADKANYSVIITEEIAATPDEIHLGYTPISKL